MLKIRDGREISLLPALTGCVAFLLGVSQLSFAEPTDVEPPAQFDRPNILLIVADDLGYSDIEPFGGEIDTPNLTSLAADGMRLINFHTAPTCSPTRSMIMSGLYSHQAGLGAMAEWVADNQRGQPGYEGYLNDRASTLPQQLKEAGYYTFMAGKWHLGMSEEHWPDKRGFEDSVAMLPGAGGHFSQQGINSRLPIVPYVQNGEPFQLPREFYSTEFYTSRAIEYLDKSKLQGGKPFFGYVAYTAPHWPLQVASSYSEKYRGRYEAGYDALKQERLKRMIKLGIVPADVMPYPGSECEQPWSALTEEERAYKSRLMEIYAGMVDSLDENIGRLIDHLKAMGEYERTVILFMSDNGADARPIVGLGGESNFIANNFNNSLENIGSSDSFVSYGSAWAEVGSFPFRLHKGMTTEGGIRVPAILKVPESNDSRGQMLPAFTSVLDILPTFLDAARSDNVRTLNLPDTSMPVLVGNSLLPSLGGETVAGEGLYPYGFSVHRRQGLQYGSWKIIRLEPTVGTGEWELYDLEKDPSETSNLATSHPDVLAEMIVRWRSFADQTGIVISDEGARAPKECVLKAAVN